MFPLEQEIGGPNGRETFGDLLSRARSGSESALGELLEQFRGFLLLTAEMTLESGVRPKVGASDLVQESIIDAHQNFRSFRGETNNEFQGWLKRILLNNLLNQYRKWKKSRRRQLSRETFLGRADSGIKDLEDPTALLPSEIACLAEDTRLIIQVIEGLPDDYREIIQLRHREQLEFEEIGRKMNRSSDAARMLWYRAFERLAAELRRQ